MNTGKIYLENKYTNKNKWRSMHASVIKFGEDYFPLNQPFTAKDPIRRLDVNLDFSTFESK